MSSFIDRNPESMIRFGTDVKTVVSDIALLVRKVEGVLDSYKSDLDGPTQSKIDQLHEYCNEYFKHIDVYQKVANDVEKKGKRLANLRNGE